MGLDSTLQGNKKRSAQKRSLDENLRFGLNKSLFLLDPKKRSENRVNKTMVNEVLIVENIILYLI